MALYCTVTSLNSKPCSNSNIIIPPLLYPKHRHPFKLITSSSSSSSSSCKTFAQSEGKEGGLREEDPHPAFSGSLSSARTQLDLLEQLSFTSSAADGYESDGRSGKLTIREQLLRLFGDRDDDFTIPLGKDLKKVTPKVLTISQKRNIKRQAYLNEVSQRNDSVFFATVGAFILVPPFIILGIAIATGYVQLFP